MLKSTYLRTEGIFCQSKESDLATLLYVSPIPILLIVPIVSIMTPAPSLQDEEPIQDSAWH